MIFLGKNLRSSQRLTFQNLGTLEAQSIFTGLKKECSILHKYCMNLTAAPDIFITLFLTTASSHNLLYKQENWKQCEGYCLAQCGISIIKYVMFCASVLMFDFL